MITTTLNRIKLDRPDYDGWKLLLKNLGKAEADDEPLPFTTILDSTGLDFTLWCCRTAPEYHRVWRWFAVWCARQAQHLVENHQYFAALDVAEMYCDNLVSPFDLTAASAEIWSIWGGDISRAVYRAHDAIRFTVEQRISTAVVDAAIAARDAIECDAWDNEWSFTSDADLALDARDIAWCTMLDRQTNEFRRLVE